MSEEQQINWPERPKPLERADGVKWHITHTLRDDGCLIAYCNEVPFCVLRPADKKASTWFVPGYGIARDHLAALQAAGQWFLGEGSKYETIVTA